MCRELNSRRASYLIVGGFAIRAAGYARQTGDIDLLVDADSGNAARVLGALATLPDGAARELMPEDLSEYGVIRVADEIVVDLMKSASGVEYADAVDEVEYHDVDGVRIPFASPRLLWRMKSESYRPKDVLDTQFLRRLLAERGELP